MRREWGRPSESVCYHKGAHLLCVCQCEGEECPQSVGSVLNSAWPAVHTMDTQLLGRRPRTPPLVLLVLVLVLVRGHPREGFFNGTSDVQLDVGLDLRGHTELSFRSCRGGGLLSKQAGDGVVRLLLEGDGTLVLSVGLAGPGARTHHTRVSGVQTLDGVWHAVTIMYRAGNLSLGLDKLRVVVANSSYHPEILAAAPLFNVSAPPLHVGQGYWGCILEGPGVVFNTSPPPRSEGVSWGYCPLLHGNCSMPDHCSSEPCSHHGVCVSGADTYGCVCRGRYSGPQCETDHGPMCERNGTALCLNGATCVDTSDSYYCVCNPAFTGPHCEYEVNACADNNPCYNNSTCRLVNGVTSCVCQPGFSGRLCDVNVDECVSSPCQHGGSCVDDINGYVCVCNDTGYTGPHCEDNIDECEINPCINGVCYDTYGGYTCHCSLGFGGQNCEMNMSECSSAPCKNGAHCYNVPGGYYCRCAPGHTGRDCDAVVRSCEDLACPPYADCVVDRDTYTCLCRPGYDEVNCTKASSVCVGIVCHNGGTCVSSGYRHMCVCAPGYTGTQCQSPVDLCQPNPCENAGTCYYQPSGYHCVCPDGYTGNTCTVEMDVCNPSPCLNDGVCTPRSRRKGGPAGYVCDCTAGWTGSRCDVNMTECQSLSCPEHSVCAHTGTEVVCQCQEGYTGQFCTETNPERCVMGSPNCVNGGCFKTPSGALVCYCQPGYSGTFCDVDFNECLSQPCKNNATCDDRVNDFYCHCLAGYTGKDCSTDINECIPNPCANDGQCEDGIGDYRCICLPGLTGKDCEIDIDDCTSKPCFNGGMCEDHRNSYMCNCSGTGFYGVHCETNIDDCEPTPCYHGGTCHDGVNSYMCMCHEGFTGPNCETDINECEPNPCQFNGTCIEYSKPAADANYTVDYSLASGYHCDCPPGTEGGQCQHNVDECQSKPCQNTGLCSDLVNGYACTCPPGFEGVHCELEIDECRVHAPCGPHGRCHDRHADYHCDCEPDYGGKNCTIRLTGCKEDSCRNRGNCTSFLQDELHHRFNCSCEPGFHGARCEEVTTMSMGEKSRLEVMTRRDEGYDIRFQFQTTLPDSLLAIGHGVTYYSLELVKGRLNLHSSLLNKWEGVFIGSDLANGTGWQKVFVQINTTHVVLSANDEQTIHPINVNSDATGWNHTSFPTTFLGTAVAHLRSLAHGPTRFIGCMQDVVVNGQWVIPEVTSEPIVSIHEVHPNCPRKPQCKPNPCENGGECTDHWNTFKCWCSRPYLGHRCQYNMTAATFGHEHQTRSSVVVHIKEASRRAVRSVMDISMFIRTRQERGAIFYMASEGGDEMVIAAQMEGGELFVRILLNGTLESYTVGGLKLADGHYHLVQVVRNVTLVQVKINQTEYFRKTISAMGFLDVHVLYLGAFPERERGAGLASATSTSAGADTTSTAANTIVCEANFKGVIQDVKVTNGYLTMVVEFFPLNISDLDIPPPFGEVTFENGTILEGVVSDDACVSQPCANNGTCYVTWNDFRCECQRGYKGKACGDMELCQLEDCPTGSTCRNLDNSYECVANVTFSGENVTGLTYTYSYPPGHVSPLDSLSLTYRTNTGGTILHVAPRLPDVRDFFSVWVSPREATLQWCLSGEVVHVHHVDADTGGDWTTLLVRLADGLVQARVDAGGGGDDEWPAPLPGDTNFSMVAWRTLVQDGTIRVGVGPPPSPSPPGDNNPVSATPMPGHVHQLHHRGNFKGCLGEMRVGGLLLPFTSADPVVAAPNLTSRPHFVLGVGAGAATPELGCVLCFDSECAHHGWCADPARAYACACPDGYEGVRCELDTDDCAHHGECLNGATCVDGVAAFWCACAPGFQGARCAEDVDECLSSPCLHHGACTNEVGTFRCECTDGYTGRLCGEPRVVTCLDAPCRNGSVCLDTANPDTGDNFTCECGRGFQGRRCETPYCALRPCTNGGTCNPMVPRCECPTGFTGDYCEVNIDDCTNHGCRNNGTCIDLINEYACNCTNTGHDGRFCERDIDECQLGTFEYRCVQGECWNRAGGYDCWCREGYCGRHCDLPDPCDRDNPCQNGGTCTPVCSESGEYQCVCQGGFVGHNCTEPAQALSSSGLDDVAMIVAPIVGLVVLVLAVGVAVFVSMARKKRATRGTYSPSQQEYCNPRVELDNVIKPPPEERLI